MYVLKTRYIVLEFPIEPGLGTKITKISEKIPKDFVLITGYIGTIRKPSVGGIPNATISLSFNNKASNPIIIEAEKGAGSGTKQKVDFLGLNEQVQDGTFIQGYIETNNIYVGTFYVKIILRGKKIVKTD
ncbi:MAG: hypothetical protein A3F72_19820 [Bacteroidetes bacterium RIFCSPLOWO2_12_FULL_35_15]|nr:MAG: hypothetical protein A3F72_19820 [Bacteroidetes bacterium RIFCSPLOWO2_12_FULL_35_15]